MALAIMSSGGDAPDDIIAKAITTPLLFDQD